jgi:nicotinate dehydrogenase subunit A
MFFASVMSADWQMTLEHSRGRRELEAPSVYSQKYFGRPATDIYIGSCGNLDVRRHPRRCGGPSVLTLTINGRRQRVDDEPATPLLYVLRNTLALNAAKFGCGLAQCGACMVLVDDQPVFSCVIPIAGLQESKITTLEGLGTLENPGPLQRAFIAEQAAQCGYCTAGMIMRAQALLLRNPTPSDAQIREHMETNLCRCGTHLRVLRAVRRASDEIRKAKSGEQA